MGSNAKVECGCGRRTGVGCRQGGKGQITRTLDFPVIERSRQKEPVGAVIVDVIVVDVIVEEVIVEKGDLGFVKAAAADEGAFAGSHGARVRSVLDDIAGNAT